MENIPCALPDNLHWSLGSGMRRVHLMIAKQYCVDHCAVRERRACGSKEHGRNVEKMEIHIRNAGRDEYKAVETIMKQVQGMHIEWRPDIYKYSETVMPLEIYEQAVKDGTFFVAEQEGNVAGILFIQYRHIENAVQVTRDIIFVDSMAVEEKYRGERHRTRIFWFPQGFAPCSWVHSSIKHPLIPHPSCSVLRQPEQGAVIPCL